MDLDDAARRLQFEATLSKKRKSLAAAGEIQTFVRTVYTLLQVCDPIIAWSDDGRQIIINDPERFGAEICPRFFRHKNVGSFTRLLNMYQFKKVGKFAFQHPNFQRGREELLVYVQRKGEIPKRLEDLEKQVRALREENARLKDLEHQRDELNTMLDDLGAFTHLVDSLDDCELRAAIAVFNDGAPNPIRQRCS